MLSTKLIVASALAALGAAPSHADPVARSYAATCSNCHGTDGRALAPAASLAGESKAFIISRLADFASGRRPATVMHQIARGYSEAQVELIATYFASQKREATP